MIAYCGYHSFYYISSHSFNCISMSVFLDGMMGYASILGVPHAPFWVAFNKTHTKILRQAHQNSKTISNSVILTPLEFLYNPRRERDNNARRCYHQ